MKKFNEYIKEAKLDERVDDEEFVQDLKGEKEKFHTSRPDRDDYNVLGDLYDDDEADAFIKDAEVEEEPLGIEKGEEEDPESPRGKWRDADPDSEEPKKPKVPYLKAAQQWQGMLRHREESEEERKAGLRSITHDITHRLRDPYPPEWREEEPGDSNAEYFYIPRNPEMSPAEKQEILKKLQILNKELTSLTDKAEARFPIQGKEVKMPNFNPAGKTKWILGGAVRPCYGRGILEIKRDGEVESWHFGLSKPGGGTPNKGIVTIPNEGDDPLRSLWGKIMDEKKRYVLKRRDRGDIEYSGQKFQQADLVDMVNRELQEILADSPIKSIRYNSTDNTLEFGVDGEVIGGTLSYPTITHLSTKPHGDLLSIRVIPAPGVKRSDLQEKIASVFPEVQDDFEDE